MARRAQEILLWCAFGLACLALAVWLWSDPPS